MVSQYSAVLPRIFLARVFVNGLPRVYHFDNPQMRHTPGGLSYWNHLTLSGQTIFDQQLSNDSRLSLRNHLTIHTYFCRAVGCKNLTMKRQIPNLK